VFQGVVRAEQPEIDTPVARGRGRRILIVDDNEDAARMLALALTYAGYETSVAFDGLTALSLAAPFQPHAALLDLGLPVIDGFELASRLRALEGLSSLKLVAITGYGRPDDRTRTLKAGFDQHVVKPLDLKEFEVMLAGILESP
jgi:DNA-binding response OmpR family regulator